jgi:hypothetical protein
MDRPIGRCRKGTTTILIMTQQNSTRRNDSQINITGPWSCLRKTNLEIMFLKTKIFFLSFPPKITFFTFFYLIENAGNCNIKLFTALFNLPL